MTKQSNLQSRITNTSQNTLIGMLAFLLVLKVLFTFLGEVAADEAYYWTWSQVPALSYYDHPPLNAWLIGITDFIFGTNVLGLRAGTILSFVGTVYFFWLFAKRLSPDQHTKHLLLCLVAFLAAPTLLVWSTIVYNDHLLILFSLGAAYWFADYFAAYTKDRNASARPLYLAAAFLGLAGLTKYNAAFMGIAVAGLIVLHPRLRPMLAQRHIYIAAAITFLLMLPMVFWNISNDFASFQLHLSARFDGHEAPRFHAETFARYIYSTIIYFGPMLLVPMVLLFFPLKTEDPFAQFGIWIARAVILTSIGTFTFLSTRGTVHWYWNCVAFTLMIVYLPLIVRQTWQIWVHVTLGALVLCIGLFSFTVMPFGFLLGTPEHESARMMGWPELAERTKEHQAAYDPDHLATTTYQGTGSLGFALDNVEIYDLDRHTSHYDFVDRKDLPAGSSALVLHDRFGHRVDVTTHFERVTKIESYQIVRMDNVLATYEFFYGEGYIPRAEQDRIASEQSNAASN